MVLLGYIAVIAIQILFAAFILFLCLAFVTGGPFVPSSNKRVIAMITMARLKKGMTVYDLGSGDGRMLFAAAALGARATGIEINPYLVWYTRIRAFFSPYRGRIRVVWANLWKSDISKAQIVFIYLIPWRMADLAKKLTSELKPGTLIVTNSFVFPGWKIVRQDFKNHVFVYKR